MSDRLTDKQLDNLSKGHLDGFVWDQIGSLATELIALRAERVKLVGAVRSYGAFIRLCNCISGPYRERCLSLVQHTLAAQPAKSIATEDWRISPEYRWGKAAAATANHEPSVVTDVLSASIRAGAKPSENVATVYSGIHLLGCLTPGQCGEAGSCQGSPPCKPTESSATAWMKEIADKERHDAAIRLGLHAGAKPAENGATEIPQHKHFWPNNNGIIEPCIYCGAKP